jgi:hypothetical protein
MGIIGDYKRNKRFFEYIEANGYVPESEEEDDLRVIIRIGDTKINVPYKLCDPYIINGWNITFAIVYGEDGRRLLLIDREGIEEVPEVLPFEEGVAEIENVTCKKKKGKLRISVESEN